MVAVVDLALPLITRLILVGRRVVGRLASLVVTHGGWALFRDISAMAMHAGIDRADCAQAYCMKDMPPAWLEGARNSPVWPIMTAMSPSLEGDAESLAWAQSAPPSELYSGITQPTLVLVGERTLPIMTAAAHTLATHLPNATIRTIAGADHAWDHAAIVKELTRHLRH